MSVNYRVHASLHPNCHNQIVHASFNLHITYPLLPNQYLIQDYKMADTSNFIKALDVINWEKLFSHKNINAQETAFHETILNIFRNYVPNKYITCDDKYLV